LGYAKSPHRAFRTGHPRHDRALHKSPIHDHRRRLSCAHFHMTTKEKTLWTSLTYRLRTGGYVGQSAGCGNGPSFKDEACTSRFCGGPRTVLAAAPSAQPSSGSRLATERTANRRMVGLASAGPTPTKGLLTAGLCPVTPDLACCEGSPRSCHSGRIGWPWSEAAVRDWWRGEQLA
jgi:hypothetical protein